MISAFGVVHEIEKSWTWTHGGGIASGAFKPASKLTATERLRVKNSGTDQYWKPKNPKKHAAKDLNMGTRRKEAARSKRESAGLPNSPVKRPLFAEQPKPGFPVNVKNPNDKLKVQTYSKSFVPGRGYKAAKDLSAMERKIVGAKAQGKTIRLKTKSGGEKLVRATPNRAQNAPSAKGRKIWEGISTPRGKLTKVVQSREQTGAGGTNKAGIQGFSNPDGRGGGRVVIHSDADFATTARHEMAHIKPRRNPVNFQRRVMKNPQKLGKEEGRADFIGNKGRVTPGSYPGNAEFQRGYNEVQGKMSVAQRQKAAKKNPPGRYSFGG
jgi:hypothetical protein